MRIRPAVVILAVACLACPGQVSADVVIDWNNVLLETFRARSLGPPPATRALAMMNLAMFDAVNSIAGTHRPYLDDFTDDPTIDRAAAAAQAAHHVLSGLFPTEQASYDTALATSLGGIPDGPAKTAGINLGNTVGAAMLANRANDGATTMVPYTPGTDPGDWQPTPPAFAPAAAPQWAGLAPFAMTSPSQFRNLDGPPALDSPEYAAALNEVKAIGSATSTTRTPEQSDIARFWAGPPGIGAPGQVNRVAQSIAESQGNTLEENARLFALHSIAEADGLIATWDTKYHYDHWRPVTAIRAADTDGNPATDADPAWSSFIPTPPFPAYTSAHSTVSAATAAVLAGFYGTDNISFTASAEGVGVPDRSFTSFSQAAIEAGESRIYGGIHWRYDNLDGLAAGQALGQFIFATQLQAIPEPGTFALLAVALASCLACRRWGRNGG
jgi:hypothetical protein